MKSFFFLIILLRNEIKYLKIIAIIPFVLNSPATPSLNSPTEVTITNDVHFTVDLVVSEAAVK